jgi:release factor glutamine methyltransferase
MAAALLDAAGVANARLEAEFLLAHLLDTDRGGLLVRRTEQLPDVIAEHYASWIDRRAAREPAQHITGTQEFYGLEFRVDSRVLIPRPETEGIIDVVLALDLPPKASVVDLGTGSGCIAVTLAVRRPDLEVHALDISGDALEVARANAALHGVGDRIEFVHADLSAPPAGWSGRVNVIVSNPPYVPAGDLAGLQSEVRDHDPRSALVAGPTGLEAYQALVPVARDLLVSEGHLVLELGFEQDEAVRRLVEAGGFRLVEIRPDMQQIPRILVARGP